MSIPREMSLSEGWGSLENDLATRYRTAADAGRGPGLHGRQRAGRLSFHGARRRVRFRPAVPGAFAVHPAVEVREGPDAAVSDEGDGIQSGSGGAVDFSVPGDGTHRGPAPGSEAPVSPALHEGGHRSAGGGGRDPGRPVWRGHAAHDAGPVRGLRRCAVRASGGALEQPSVSPAPVRDVPSPSSDDDQDPAGAGEHRRAAQASSRSSTTTGPATPPSRRQTPRDACERPTPSTASPRPTSS